MQDPIEAYAITAFLAQRKESVVPRELLNHEWC
jgi:hypothetical protein